MEGQPFLAEAQKRPVKEKGLYFFRMKVWEQALRDRNGPDGRKAEAVDLVRFSISTPNKHVAS